MLNLMERFSSTPTGREGEGDAATAFENGGGAGGRGTWRRALARRPGQGEGDTAGRDVATPGGPAPAPAAPAAARRTASAGVGNRLMKQIRNSILRFFFFFIFFPKIAPDLFDLWKKVALYGAIATFSFSFVVPKMKS